VIFTIDAVVDWDDPRHRSSGYESSGDGGTTFLSGDPLFHQPDIALLLLVGAALRAQRSF
jgi:hypothetical protein